MKVRLIESLATTEALTHVFSDEAVVGAMLDFEVALARVESRLGVIPKTAARVIAKCARVENFDPAVLARSARNTGTPAAGLVNALRSETAKTNWQAADYVHWGATSQDVCDTALLLLIRPAQALIESDLARLQAALRRLANEHQGTVMLGRTLLQPATPITFGLKAAGWYAAVGRGENRLQNAAREALVLQFGGASGTLAVLGKSGIEVGQGLARELRLEYPAAPWHSYRDRMAALLCAHAILSGSVAKIARDIILLAQHEVGEVYESSEAGRGASSTMPHKQNPAGCVVALAAVAQIPGLVSSLLSGMTQEHERAAGAWQAEWSTVSRVIQGAGLAIASMADVAEELQVNRARMRANIEATRGAVFAEQARTLLSPKLGRKAADKILSQAIQLSREQNRNFKDVLAAMDEANQHLDATALRNLEKPEQYLGVAQEFQKRLLTSGKLSRSRRRRKD